MGEFRCVCYLFIFNLIHSIISIFNFDQLLFIIEEILR